MLFRSGTIITNTNPNRFQLSPDSLSLLIHKQGLYDIEWYLNSEGMNSGGQIQVALELIHTNGIITYQYNSFAITPNAALSGQFLINAPTPIILRFLNTSDGAFSLSSHTSMQGNFKILGF